MRILVVSDSHGSMAWFDKIKTVFDSVDCVIHLGDHQSDAEKIRERVKIPVYAVSGNCDFGSGESEICQYIGGIKVFATHGHRYRVDNDIYAISAAAREHEAALCLYGHTHVPDITNFYGIWFVNPGSVSRPRSFSGPTYAIIEIDKKGEIKPDILRID